MGFMPMSFFLYVIYNKFSPRPFPQAINVLAHKSLACAVKANRGYQI